VSATDAQRAPLDHLLSLDDSQFLAAIYKHLLGRHVDPAGFRDYHARLRGGASRLQIMAEIRDSDEGRRHGSDLPGLAEAMISAPDTAAPPPSARPSLRSLFRLSDEAFVDALHWALLDHPATNDERVLHAERLRAGLPKMTLLADMLAQASPPDAEQRIEGLDAILPALSKGLCPVALDLEDLLSLHDAAFVDCAYLTLVGRRPDEQGLAHYTARLRAGHAKIAVADELWRSSEGRRVGSTLPGMAKASSRWRAARLPLLGAVLRAVLAIEGDSPAERRARVLENRLERLLQSTAQARLQAAQAATAMDAWVRRAK
jgi:hypothetical protein